MRIKLTTFAILIFVVLVIFPDAFFIRYYYDMRDKTANILIRELETSITELGFVINKNLKESETEYYLSMKKSKPILDRKVATNPYIESITIFKDKKPIVYTHHKKISLPNDSLHITHKSYNLDYNYIINATSLVSELKTYNGLDKKEYKLVYYLNNSKINSALDSDLRNYILVFLITPTLILLIVSHIVGKTVIGPLKIINRYAYYQLEKPKDFIVLEINELKNSIVETIERLEKEKDDLYVLARTDTLSGVSNRHAMEEFVNKLIKESNRKESKFALLFLDLDNFKTVNNTLGHDIGDMLLKDIAMKISSILRANDHIARIGGDEFVIVLSEYDTSFDLIQAVKRIENVVSVPNSFNGYDMDITASIGISIFPTDATDIIGLMKQADIALYRSKDNGKNQHSFYTTEIDEEIQEFISLSSDMKEALKNNEYTLYYQPQNDVKNGKIIGCETLLRWEHPTKGFISPAKFIPLAEQSGFIVELGAWVLDEALQQKKTWEENGIDIKMSINVAAKQVICDNFIEILTTALTKYDINNSNVALEITEYIFINDTDKVLEIFEEIKKLGIKIYLDDFGTGYSSLAYLKKFPIDALKIDKSFIDDYDHEQGAIFIETIIKMAKTLKLGVVAEGVEKPQQLRFLRKMGCETFQGYLAMKPVPSEIFSEEVMKCINYE